MRILVNLFAFASRSTNMNIFIGFCVILHLSRIQCRILPDETSTEVRSDGPFKYSNFYKSFYQTPKTDEDNGRSRPTKVTKHLVEIQPLESDFINVKKPVALILATNLPTKHMENLLNEKDLENFFNLFSSRESKVDMVGNSVVVKDQSFDDNKEHVDDDSNSDKQIVSSVQSLEEKTEKKENSEYFQESHHDNSKTNSESTHVLSNFDNVKNKTNKHLEDNKESLSHEFQNEKLKLSENHVKETKVNDFLSYEKVWEEDLLDEKDKSDEKYKGREEESKLDLHGSLQVLFNKTEVSSDQNDKVPRNKDKLESIEKGVEHVHFQLDKRPNSNYDHQKQTLTPVVEKAAEEDKESTHEYSNNKSLLSSEIHNKEYEDDKKQNDEIDNKSNEDAYGPTVKEQQIHETPKEVYDTLKFIHDTLGQVQKLPNEKQDFDEKVKVTNVNNPLDKSVDFVDDNEKLELIHNKPKDVNQNNYYSKSLSSTEYFWLSKDFLDVKQDNEESKNHKSNDKPVSDGHQYSEKNKQSENYWDLKEYFDQKHDYREYKDDEEQKDTKDYNLPESESQFENQKEHSQKEVYNAPKFGHDSIGTIHEDVQEKYEPETAAEININHSFHKSPTPEYLNYDDDKQNQELVLYKPSQFSEQASVSSENFWGLKLINDINEENVEHKVREQSDSVQYNSLEKQVVDAAESFSPVVTHTVYVHDTPNEVYDTHELIHSLGHVDKVVKKKQELDTEEHVLTSQKFELEPISNGREINSDHKRYEVLLLDPKEVFEHHSKKEDNKHNNKVKVESKEDVEQYNEYKEHETISLDEKNSVVLYPTPKEFPELPLKLDLFEDVHAKQKKELQADRDTKPYFDYHKSLHLDQGSTVKPDERVFSSEAVNKDFEKQEDFLHLKDDNKVERNKVTEKPHEKNPRDENRKYHPQESPKQIHNTSKLLQKTIGQVNIDQKDQWDFKAERITLADKDYPSMLNLDNNEVKTIKEKQSIEFEAELDSTFNSGENKRRDRKEQNDNKKHEKNKDYKDNTKGSVKENQPYDLSKQAHNVHDIEEQVHKQQNEKHEAEKVTVVDYTKLPILVLNSAETYKNDIESQKHIASQIVQQKDLSVETYSPKGDHKVPKDKETTFHKHKKHDFMEDRKSSDNVNFELKITGSFDSREKKLDDVKSVALSEESSLFDKHKDGYEKDNKVTNYYYLEDSVNSNSNDLTEKNKSYENSAQTNSEVKGDSTIENLPNLKPKKPESFQKDVFDKQHNEFDFNDRDDSQKKIETNANSVDLKAENNKELTPQLPTEDSFKQDIYESLHKTKFDSKEFSLHVTENKETGDLFLTVSHAQNSKQDADANKLKPHKHKTIVLNKNGIVEIKEHTEDNCSTDKHDEKRLYNLSFLFHK